MFDKPTGDWVIVPATLRSEDDQSIHELHRYDVESFLRQFKSDYGVMAHLREVLYGTDPVSGFTDDQVIETVSRRLANRTLVLRSAASREQGGGGGGGGGQQGKANAAGAGAGTPAAAQPKPKGAIRVQIVDDKGRGVATIEVTGPGSKKTNASGIAMFEALAEGTYNVNVVTPLPDAVRKDFYLALADARKPAHVTAGAVTDVKIQLERRPWPTIKAEAPKIVLVKHTYQGKPKPAKPDVKPHRIPVTLGFEGTHDGGGELSCAHAERIAVFEHADEAKAQKLPWNIKAGDLQGKIVFVEGIKASDAMSDTELKLTLKNGTIPPKKDSETDKITCILLQLDIYKWRPDDGSDPVVIGEGPKIDPGRAVLVQGTTDTRLWAQRAKMVLAKATPHAYTGKLVLKPITDSVEAFAADKEKPAPGQKALSGGGLTFSNGPDGPIDQAKGLTLWVQGKTLSGQMGDTGWTVELQELPGKEGDRVTMTAIQAELALYKSRKDTPAKVPRPEAFGDAEKFDQGRYVHLQSAGFEHGRGMIVVKKVKPDKFVGTLVLTAWDAKHKPSYSAVKSGAPKVKVFDAEVAARGQAAKGLPLEIDHPLGYPADGTAFWVEGSTVSGALGDCELRLGVKEVDTGCDRVEFTVVSFSNFKADVPSTPAHIKRNRWDGGPANNPTPRHDFVAGANDVAKHFSDDFTVNLPLPLVEASVGNDDQIKLSVELKPSGLKIPVSWSAIRSFDDNKEIKDLPGNADDPGMHPGSPESQKATMEGNAAGSFRVRAFIDCNGDTKFDERDDAGARVDREPFILMNLVLYRVQGVNNTSDINNTAHDPAKAGETLAPSGIFTSGGVPARISLGDFAGGGNDAMDMKAVIRVIGGGADGLRGLKPDCYLFAGWMNNELNCPTAPNPHHWSEDATHHHQRPPAAPAPRPLLGLRCFWQLDGARIPGPILDAGGRYRHRRGTGGDSCIGTMGGGEPATNKLADPSGIGENWTVANSDSPGGPITTPHPNDAQAQVVRFNFNLNFQSALLVWTNTNKTPGPAAAAGDTDNACCRLYSVIQNNTWQVRFESTFDAAFAETNTVAKDVTRVKVGDATRRAVPVKGTDFETRAPGGLDQNHFDTPFDPAHPEHI